MAMQFDVKSTRRTTAGSIYGDRTRVKGIYVSPAISTAATLELRDGGATGNILCQIDVPSVAAPVPYYISVPGEGMLHLTNVYLTFSVGSVTGVTVFYG